jgi:hypothetical protein
VLDECANNVGNLPVFGTTISEITTPLRMVPVVLSAGFILPFRGSLRVALTVVCMYLYSCDLS